MKSPNHRHLVVEDKAKDVVEYGFGTQTANLHVAEPVISEQGLPNTGIIGGNVAVGAFCAAEVVDIQCAVRIECFGIAEGDGVAWFHFFQNVRQHTDHVLPHVEYPFVALLEYIFRLQVLVGLDVGVGLWGEELHRVGPLVVVGQRAARDNGILAGNAVARIVDVLLVHVLPVVVDNGLLPLAVVVVGLLPLPEVEAGVVGLAVKLVALAYGTAVGNLPPLATDYRVGGAVLVGHFQLHQQLRQAVVGSVMDAAPFEVVLVMAHGGEASACERDAHGVQAVFTDEVGHVVGIEIDAPRVIRKCGFQVFANSDLLTIEIGTINTQAADVKARLGDVLLERKLLAQVAGSNGGVAVHVVVLIVAPNPMCVPVVGREQTYLKVLHIALHLGFPPMFAVCHSRIHLPKAPVAALQLLARVWDIEHVRRFDNLRVPQVADALAGVLFRRCHHDTVFDLHHIIPHGIVLPAEPRLGGGQRLAAVLPLHGKVAQLDSAIA